MAHQSMEDKVFAMTPESLQKVTNHTLRSRLRGVDKMLLDYEAQRDALQALEELVEAEIRRRGFTIEAFVRQML